MNIGEAARISGVSAKNIRHYEAIGLAPQPDRSEAGYRVYSDQNVHTLAFIARARDLGFSVPRTAELVALWADRNRACAEVKRVAMEHIEILEQKAQALQEMTKTLKYLAENCRGDRRPVCPTIEGRAKKVPGRTKAPPDCDVAAESLQLKRRERLASNKATAKKTARKKTPARR